MEALDVSGVYSINNDNNAYIAIHTYTYVHTYQHLYTRAHPR